MGTDDLSKIWATVEARLPPGWNLDGLRCASASLRQEDRSDDWIAVAIDPGGDERTFQAEDPVAALEGLGESVGRYSHPPASASG